ncbi:hypothetical protein D3C80_2227530 [compost metagenome]
MSRAIWIGVCGGISALPAISPLRYSPGLKRRLAINWPLRSAKRNSSRGKGWEKVARL